MSYKNAPIHPVLRFIYAFLRVLTWAGTHVYYRRIRVLGREHLRFDGPAIVVCNHPSTLMDPLNVGLHIRQEMFFLANYGLFKNPVSGWILSRLFCIPVKRREDVEEGAERNNDAAFEMSYQHLEKNGVLFIAAEGVSWMNRFVRPFKTGAARIAFGTEKRNNWQLGVKIIPVGLTYTAPQLFRSGLTVEFGAPIAAAEWADAWNRQPEQAVEDFTNVLRQGVSGLTLDSGSEAGDAFVTQIETLLENDADSGNLPPAQAALSAPGARHHFLKTFLQKHLHNEALSAKTAQYSADLQALGLEDAALTPGKRYMPLLLLLGLPLFLIGYVCWFLPCLLPALLVKRLKLYVGYDSTVKFLSGLILFPIFFALGQHWVGGYVWLSIPLGYFADWYMEQAKKWRARRKWTALAPLSPAHAGILTTRNEIRAALYA